MSANIFRQQPFIIDIVYSNGSNAIRAGASQKGYEYVEVAGAIAISNIRLKVPVTARIAVHNAQPALNLIEER